MCFHTFGILCSTYYIDHNVNVSLIVHQMMWMGSGMASMMLPGVQQYISGIGMGMGHVSMPAIPNAVQLPRVSIANQSVTPTFSSNQTTTFPSPATSSVNCLNQLQNHRLPESYSRYLSMHMMPPHQVSSLTVL